MIFLARRVITVEDDDKGRAEAVASHNGRIVGIGSLQEVARDWKIFVQIKHHALPTLQI